MNQIGTPATNFITLQGNATMKPYLVKLLLCTGITVKTVVASYTIDQAVELAMHNNGDCQFIYAWEV